jgi:hypothetical protein
MRTRLDIMIHVDMDCDELLLGGVKAVTAMLSGTCVTWAQSRSNVSVALVRCMALSPLSREINVDRSLKSLKRAHVKNLTEPNGTAPQMDPRTRTVLFSSVCRDRVYRLSLFRCNTISAIGVRSRQSAVRSPGDVPRRGCPPAPQAWATVIKPRLESRRGAHDLTSERAKRST